MEMGPEGFQKNDVFLRTAISVEPSGWTHYDYVKMPDYRWGIFLVPHAPNHKIGFGDNEGAPVWQEVSGEFRTQLRRFIVTQGDTEPASVEQQRQLEKKTAPSLYDLRNLFQGNVEEGRYLWAMVYLLHSYFGHDGCEEAEELLERRSGNEDKPRILAAFNEPCDDWLNSMFTGRDGKYQLLALAASGFDLLDRTTKFMLTEEAFHMSVGETGVGRIIERTADLMRAHRDDDVRKHGGMDLPTIQKYLNFLASASTDLFGGEISTNTAQYFAAGLKGQNREESYQENKALQGAYKMTLFKDGGLVEEEVPLRNAMNEILRDDYLADCQHGVDCWNKVLEEAGILDRLTTPRRRFHREIGIYAGLHCTPEGSLITEEEWSRKRNEWLPSDNDQAYLKTLMHNVDEPGKTANWIAPPKHGVKGRPFEFEYVRKI